MFRAFLILIVFVFAIWTIGTSLTQVQPGERAVIRRFGRILDDKPEAGLYIGWPWGIDRVERVPVGLVRRISVGFSDKDAGEEDIVPAGQMLTGDHNLGNVQAEIYFKVRKDQVEKFVLLADQVDALTARAAETILAEWIAGRTVDEALLRGKIDLPRFLRERLQQRLDQYDLGVEIEQASVTKLFPPAEVKEAFDRLAQAQTGIRTMINQAEQEADRNKSTARAEAYKIDRLAQAYARAERIKSDAEAESFRRRLDQYRDLTRVNPDYLNTLWLDEMTRLFRGMRDGGRIDLLDHYLSNGELTITQFPLQPRKK